MVGDGENTRECLNVEPDPESAESVLFARPSKLAGEKVGKWALPKFCVNAIVWP
jgi:hypothetical protein